jgi:RNA polymerase sigma factor (sigma-70 family)
MSTSTLGLFLRHLALSEEVSRLGMASDRDLLTAYELERGQAAFTELVRRHGPMVLRTCRRLLGRGPDAEDAFQATFVLLARKAGQLRREAAAPLSLGGWLHRVAYRTAADVLTGKIRRKAHERQASAMTHPDPDPSTEATWNEVRPILDAELDALPDEARRLLIACYLQEKTHAEAAAELGLPQGSIAWHLQRARTLLAARLARRGITVSALLLAVLLEDSAKGAGVPAVLQVHTVEMARTFPSQEIGVVSENVARLVRGGLSSMAKSSAKFGLVLACCLGLMGAGLATCRVLSARPDEPNEAVPAETQAADRSRVDGRTVRVDCFGDPLPAHALTRMGTVRFWHSKGWDGDSCVPVFSPDGKTLAAPLDGRTVCLWDMATGKEIRRLTSDAAPRNRRDWLPPIVALGFSPEGKTLVAMNWEQTVFHWEVATSKFLRKEEYQGPKRDNILYLKVAFCPDGRILGFGNFLKAIENGKGVRGAYVWDVATGKEICQLNRPLKQWEGGRTNTVFSRDGRTLTTVTTVNNEEKRTTISLWEVATGKEINQLVYKDAVVDKLVFSPDGKTLVSSEDDKTICLWETATGKRIHLFQAEETHCGPLAYSPDGKTLVGGRVGHLWDVGTGKKIRSFGWDDAAFAVFSPNGKTVVTGDTSGAIRLWEVATGKEIGPRKGLRGRIQRVAYSPDGKTLASLGTQIFGRGGNEKTVRVWDAATGKEVRQVAKGSRSVACSPDGKTLVSTMDDGVLHLWDMAADKEIRPFEAANYNPRSATFSPDGKKLAARMRNDRRTYLWVWEVATGRKIFSLPTEVEDSNLSANVETIAFSPDGRLLAIDGKDNTISLWEVATGTRLRQLDGLRQPAQPGEIFVRFLAFSPDGRMLAASSLRDNKVRLWDVASGKEVGQLSAYNQRKGEQTQTAQRLGCSLAFSPDGRMLATAAQGKNCDGVPDREVRLWEVASGKEVGRLIGHQAPVRAVAFSPDGKTLATGSDDLTCLVWDLASVGPLKPVPTRPFASGVLSKERLEAAWADLGKDPANAYTAVGTLREVPAQAILLLRERIQPVVPPPDPQRLRRWIADLDSDSFAVRDRAQREIEKLREAALPALRQALQGQPSLEMKRRLQDLVAELEPRLVGGAPERLRELRAVQVLESLGTTEARRLLQTLAQGVAEAHLTVEAEAALARLAKRSAPGP